MIYKCWRKFLKGNKTEYKSQTIMSDSTKEELMDFYMDDSYRHTWDAMVT